LSELGIHHVDLGIGYRVADWPDGFAAERLAGEPGMTALVSCSRNGTARPRVNPAAAACRLPPGNGRSLSSRYHDPSRPLSATSFN
jgi:hypothetical protein